MISDLEGRGGSGNPHGLKLIRKNHKSFSVDRRLSVMSGGAAGKYSTAWFVHSGAEHGPV